MIEIKLEHTSVYLLARNRNHHHRYFVLLNVLRRGAHYNSYVFCQLWAAVQRRLTYIVYTYDGDAIYTCGHDDTTQRWRRGDNDDDDDDDADDDDDDDICSRCTI